MKQLHFLFMLFIYLGISTDIWFGGTWRGIELNWESRGNGKKDYDTDLSLVMET